MWQKTGGLTYRVTRRHGLLGETDVCGVSMWHPLCFSGVDSEKNSVSAKHACMLTNLFLGHRKLLDLSELAPCTCETLPSEPFFCVFLKKRRTWPLPPREGPKKKTKSNKHVLNWVVLWCCRVVCVCGECHVLCVFCGCFHWRDVV